MGKFWGGKNWQIEGHSPILPANYYILGSMLTIHEAHSPILNPPTDPD